jgi:hypothetical protein
MHSSFRPLFESNLEIHRGGGRITAAALIAASRSSTLPREAGIRLLIEIFSIHV